MKKITNDKKIIILEKDELKLMELVEHLVILYKIQGDRFVEDALTPLSNKILEMIEEYSYIVKEFKRR